MAPRKKSNTIASLLLPIRLCIGRRLFGTVSRHGVKVSRRRLIKGPCDESELAAMEYVAKHTSIPIPKVYNSFRHADRIYIEMEFVRGTDLQAAWLHGLLTPEQKQQLLTEISGYIDQMRSLKPPHPEAVGSASPVVGKCLDHRIGSWPFGPFQKHEEFHSFLRRNLALEYSTASFGQEVTDCHSRQYRSCFTHADICARNIIIENGKVAAIIDWETAGWYPEYWEYTKAHFVRLEMSDWYEGLESLLHRYDDELKAERALWRRCDTPGDTVVAHYQ
ncbi:hypothetical protein BDV06DRAFT_136956 [Aspergillus oleicola]